MKIKSTLATCLAILMVIGSVSFIDANHSGAASKPSIKTKVTIDKGKSVTLDVKPNGYTITRIIPKSSKKTIATANNKNSYILIKGKNKGTCTVTTSVKARKGKKTKTFKLKTKVIVRVTKATSVTVTSFKDLKSALTTMNTDGGTVYINSSEDGTYEIPKASYKKVNLVVSAPSADFINYATFKSITIESMRPEKWLEKASGNTFTIKSTNAVKMVIDMGASVKTITFDGTVSTAVQTIDCFGTLSSAYISNIAPVKINASAETSRIGLIEISANGVKTEISANLGSSISRIRILKPSNTILTGNSTSAIKIEKNPVAVVSVEDSLTGVIVESL